MKIYIYDYNKARKEVEIKKEVYSSFLITLSGDQILCVRYIDGTQEIFDACDTYRAMDFIDDYKFVDLYDGKDFKEGDFINN